MLPCTVSGCSEDRLIVFINHSVAPFVVNGYANRASWLQLLSLKTSSSDFLWFNVQGFTIAFTRIKLISRSLYLALCSVAFAYIF